MKRMVSGAVALSLAAGAFSAIVPASPVAALEVFCSPPDHMVVLTPPGDLRPGRTESSVCFSTYVERSGVSLATALQVDDVIADPGVWLPAGSVVTSRIVHVDKLGSTSAPVAVSGQLVLPEPVVGIVFTQSRLVGSDTRLGIAGSRYAASGRGAEAGDSVVVEPDGHTVTFTLTTTSDVDDVRIITGTLGSRNATTTALTVTPSSIKLGASSTLRATVSRVAAGTAPTGSVTFYDESTPVATRTLSGGAATFTTTAFASGAHTITAVYSGDARWLSSTSGAVGLDVRVSPVCASDRFVPIGPPLNVTQGVWDSNSCLFLHDERTVTLATGLVVDRPATAGGSTTIPAGTTVSSVLVHVDKLGDTTAIVPISGGREFPLQIVGLITSASRLNATNALLGAPGTVYPTASNRGLEANDIVSVDPGLRDVTFAISAANGVDQIRVLMVNTPPECAEDGVEIEEDVPASIIVPCTDPDGDPIGYSIDSTSNVSASVTGDELTITSDPDFNGDASVTLVADDGFDTTTFTIPVTVLPTNDAPVCQPATPRVIQGGTVVFDLDCDDIDGDELTAGLVDAPINGDATVEGLTVTYAHGGGSSGDSLAIEVSDGSDVVVPNVVVAVVVPKGIITPAQPTAAADPARRYVGNEVFELPDGGAMVVAFGFPLFGQNYTASFLRLDADMRTDIDFGVDGVLNQPLPAGFSPSNIARDESGGLLALGGGFSVVRFDEEGNLDTSFGTNGQSAAPATPPDFTLAGVFEATRQPDGKIVAVGYGWQGPNGFNHQWVVVARYNADGSIDTGFGDDGLALREATWPSASCSSSDPYTRLRANDVVLQPDGMILLVGSHHWCGTDHVAVMRLEADGDWDPGFGVGGMTNGAALSTGGEGRSIWVESGGAITVAGTRMYGLGVGGVIHRYLSNGAPDPGFGDNGRVVLGVGQIVPDAVGRGDDGSFYFAGTQPTSCCSNYQLAVVKADASGDVDLSFGNGGQVQVAVGPIGSYGARSVINLASGAIGIVGYSGSVSSGDVAAYHRFDAASGTPV